MFEVDLYRNVQADELTEEFVDGAMALPEGRFRRALEQLWRTGKFIHRQEALTFVGYKLNNARASSLGEWEPYVREALADPDSSLREMAMNILVKTVGIQAEPELLAELEDPDHELRVVAMRHLRNLRATNTLPAVATQLYEDNPRLVCEAVNWMQRLTAVDHGMQSKWISRRALIGPQEASLNHSNYLHARASAMTWWKTNASAWAATATPKLPHSPTTESIKLNDYELRNADLTTIDPQILGDRPLLIYFFTTWKSAAAAEAMDVRAFHEEMVGKATVLGVSLDTVPDEHNENQLAIMFEKDDEGHSHGHGHGHDHSGDYEMAYDAKEIIQETERKISNMGFKFPVVYDVTGRFMNRLNGTEVPTLVMLDAERRVFRRMTGPRRLQSLIAMAEAAGAK
ncbi:MAG: hypothetical protein ACPGVU_01450 [Limisphaerales bacterium]